MKLKIETIMNSISFMRELNTFKFMPRTTLDLYKLCKVLDREAEEFNELRKEIAKKHTDEKGNLNLEAFNTEIIAIAQQEVEVPVTKIPFSVIEKATDSLEANILLHLDWLIDMDDPEKQPKAKTKTKTA